MPRHDGASGWRHGHRMHHKPMGSGAKGKGLDKKLKAEKMSYGRSHRRSRGRRGNSSDPRSVRFSDWANEAQSQR